MDVDPTVQALDAAAATRAAAEPPVSGHRALDCSRSQSLTNVQFEDSNRVMRLLRLRFRFADSPHRMGALKRRKLTETPLAPPLFAPLPETFLSLSPRIAFSKVLSLTPPIK